MTPLDLTAIRSRSDHAEKWVRHDPDKADQFLPLSFREHFGRDVPALLAEVDLLRSENRGLRLQLGMVVVDYQAGGTR